MRTKLAIGSVVGGVLITLLTGLLDALSSHPLLDFYSEIGLEHCGFPLPWLRRAVYPGAPLEMPPEYYANLVVDIVIWAIVVGVVLFIVTRRYTK